MNEQKSDAISDIWDLLENYKDEQTVITVKITEAVKGGVVAFVEGVRGFIPASRLSLGYIEKLEDWLKKEVQVQVIEADRTNNTLILSARELLREARAKEQEELLASVQPGLVCEGTVETLQPYGAFVRLENGLSGLVHISQISTNRIQHPSVVLKEGQSVQVKVIGVKDGKISLSMKALQEPSSEQAAPERVDLPASESIGTSLGSLFQNIHLDA